MKKSIITALSILLTFLILTQTMSIAVFAIDDQSEKITDETAENAEPVNDLADMPDIVSEVESKRDAYKKDFLLEDGSFCSVITTNPIHEYTDGKWVEKIRISKYSTVDKAVADIKNLCNKNFSKSDQGGSRSENNYSESNGLIIDWADNSTYIDYDNNALWHVLSGNESSFYIKTAQVGQYISNNYLVTSAFFSLDCMLDEDEADSYLSILNEWSNDYQDMSPSSDHLLARRTVDSDGTYYYNITDYYNRIERGSQINTGFSFTDLEASDLKVSSPLLIIRYVDINSTSLDFTNHLIDLSDSGTVYINDVTNNFKVKQKLIDYSYNKTDLSVYRTYDSAASDVSNYSGVKSSFNFESELEVYNDYAEWTMFDGNLIRFVPSDPPVTNNGYEVWELLMTANSANLNAVLYLPLSENTSPDSYVLIDGIKYLFKANGSIDEISDVSSNTSVMDFKYFDYEPGKIDYIELSDGNIIEFSYSNTNYVESVEIKNQNGQTVTVNNELKKTEFGYTNSNNQIINTVSFGNGDISVYTFDSDGHLLSTVNENGLRSEFEFAEYPDYSLGSYITGYELFNGNANAAFESLTIDSENTFKRVFTDIENKEETIYYNSDYKIVNYIGTDGKYKCIDYDENGVLNSYVFDNSGSELLLYNDFSRMNLTPWTRIGKAKLIFQEDEILIDEDSNYYSVGFGSDKVDDYDLSLYQIISPIENGTPTVFEADKTYVFGGNVYLDDVLPGLDYSISIIIETAPVINGVPSADYSEHSRIVFDNTLLSEWQFRLKAIKFEEDSVVKLRLNFKNKRGYAYFAKPTFFESQDAVTDLEDMITSLPIEYTYGNNGQIASETLTWDRATETDLTMSTAYSYNQNGKLIEYEDFNGNPTYYQYDSNGILSGKGHSVDGLGNITDLNSLAYDAESVLTNTTQIIQNVENNNNITLSAGYEEEIVTENNESVNCITVHHNGYDQVFKKTPDGRLLETYAESTSYPNDFTNYNAVYQYDTDRDLVQIDYSNGYRDRYYEADYNDEYTYKRITRYEVDGLTETPVKTYTYQFDDAGNLLKSHDDSTKLLVDYVNGGYALYEIVYDGADPVLIFSDENVNGNKVQTFYNTASTQPNSGATPTDIVEKSPSEVTFDAGGIKTTNSTANVSKSIGNYIASADYDMSSTEDYFGRLTSKEGYVQYDLRNDVQGNMTLSEDYEYKYLGSGKTSGLIFEYSSTITGSCELPVNNNQSTVNISNSFSRKYEYDNRGNVKFVYTDENNTIVPKEYYEYDNANQIITEINFENHVSAHYTYDAGGNLTAKIYYDYEDLVFNISNREITTLGDEVDRITYQYDSAWKDRLINYDGTTITYDKMGNPLNYVGTNNQGVAISGTLEWSGNLLTAFESEDFRLEFEYDKNGYRSRKSYYEKHIINEETVYSLIYAFDYIWNNGVLEGFIISDINESNGHRIDLSNLNIIYDESGSPIGYMSSAGITYLFKKDINDNIISMIFPDGDELFNYVYDSWGKTAVTYSANWGNDWIHELIVYAITALCPMAYHGYLYDYETGMCFNKGRYYSPDWGRNLNPEDYEKLLDRPENPLEANLYLFCDNNPLNILDKTASWYKEYRGVEWKSNGFEVKMSDIFASRPICTLFASQIIKVHGAWDVGIGYNYLEMSIEDIASDLFAHYVGKYAKAAINKVNAVWGDGWILKNSKSDTIFVYRDDPNLSKLGKKGKYYKIWIAAPEIKAYAQKEGVFITL